MSEERIEKKINDMAENISYNTSKGSFARDIVGATAIVLVEEEDDFESKINTRLISYATGNDLDICGDDKGYKRNDPVYAVGEVKITGENGSLIKKGYRVINSSKNIEYEIVEEKVILNIFTTVKIKCLKHGTLGNCDPGQINKFAEEYIGLAKVENLEGVTNGRDLEVDEEYRKRLLNYIQKPRISWNQYVFEDEAKVISEVDKAKCIPRYAGPGTVKVIITEKESLVATEEVKHKVKNYIENKIISDIEVTIEGVEILDINIDLKAQINSDFNIEAAKEKLKETLDSYFFENLFAEKILYFDIVEKIQHAGCIYKIGDLSINGTKNDLILNSSKFCKIKIIEIREME